MTKYILCDNSNFNPKVEKRAKKKSESKTMSLPPPVVIDTGTGFTKAGFAGAEIPRAVFPSVLGVPKETVQMIGGKNVDFYVGHEAFVKNDLVSIRQPIENGNIVNWDDIEKLWHNTFYNELLVVPDQYPVILTEKQNTPQQNREKSIQLLFETFQVPGFYSGIQSVFALFSCGLTTGIVWDAGEGDSCVVPIYEGYQQPHGVLYSNISGNTLSKFFCEKMVQNGENIAFLKPNDISGLKENKCRVKKRYVEETVRTRRELREKKRSKMFDPPPDLKGQQNFDMDTPEIIFDPSIAKLTCQSIPQLIVNSLLLVDPAVRYEMLPSVVLSGGTSMFKGLPERMETEIRNIDIKPLLQRGEQLPPPKKRTRIEMYGPQIINKDDYHADDALALTPEELQDLQTDDLIRMMTIDTFNPNDKKKGDKDEKSDSKPKPKVKELSMEELIIPEAEDLRLKIPGDFLPPNPRIHLPLTDDELLLTNNGYLINYEKHKKLLREQLAKKVRTRVNLNANVIASPERKYGVWIGASVLGSMSQFPELMISKAEYQETGPWIVHTKCYS